MNDIQPLVIENTLLQKRTATFQELAFTAADLSTRIINTGWRHYTVYYGFYIDFICNIPLVLKILFLDLEQPNLA